MSKGKLFKSREFQQFKSSMVQTLISSLASSIYAINLSLNYLYVEKYGGELYVRLEDTNSENIYPQAYEMIADEANE